MIEMAVIQVSTYFGTVTAKPMRLVDIHDVQPMADVEESKIQEAEGETNTSEDLTP